MHFRSQQVYFQNFVRLVSGRDFNHTPFGPLVCADQESETFRDLVCDDPQVKWMKLGLLFFVALHTHTYLCYQAKVFCVPPLQPNIVEMIRFFFLGGEDGDKQVWI